MLENTPTPVAEAPIGSLPEAQFPDEAAPHAAGMVWFVCGRAGPDSSPQEVAVSGASLTIGRHPENALCLANSTVSGRHAELMRIGEDLYVRDLQSTNGTLVNGRQLTGLTRLNHGDTVHFGTAMFTVKRRAQRAAHATVTADVAQEALAHLQFDKLLNMPALLPHFQPIVRLANGATVGYEVLARSRLVGLETPSKMFKVAAERGFEVELSRLSRKLGLGIGRILGPCVQIYLNTHPAELEGRDLVDSLEQLRGEFPDSQIVLEIHEASVTSPAHLRDIRRELALLKVLLAYDDFGAGQARLMELAEVPPDVLKFDRGLIHEIGAAPALRQELVASLVRIVRNLNATPLAEGIESPEDAETCRQLGFELGQGFHFGRPAAATEWLSSAIESRVSMRPRSQPAT
jgi:EAL domain-containing protein (putative c-di-GMP-specific phosphodiesterase class I)